MPKSQNPKAIALFLSALVRLHRLGLVSEAEIRALANRLLELRTPGQRHVCWGYDFDWQNRHHLFPRGTPNIICTTFAGQALLDAHDQFSDPAYLDAARDAARFLLEDLERTPDGDAFCFSYTPLYLSTVHNASLLGGALLARLHSLRPTDELRDAAVRAARYSIRRQAPDGSWPYGEHPSQQWIDSFHTGYNLLALRQIAQATESDEANHALRQGFDFYCKTFFGPAGEVQYFHDRTYPIDIHAVAHAILTLSELREFSPGNLDQADRVIGWAVRHLQSSEGWFYYQKWPRWTNRISYMRWGQGWMLLALAERAVAGRWDGGTVRR